MQELPPSRTLLAFLLGTLSVMVSSGCGQEAPPAPDLEKRPTISVDGSVSDWEDVSPLWQEGGSPLEDPGFSIDVKQVRVTNDENTIFMLLSCVPTIAERLRRHPLPGKIGYLYLDVDNDRTTGTTDAELETYGYSNGYEFRLSLDVDIMRNEEGVARHCVRYVLEKLDREEVERTLERLAGTRLANNPIMRQVARKYLLWSRVEEGCGNSLQPGAQIASGEDGVELAVPLKLLGLTTYKGIRLLLVEEAHDYDLDGYSVRYYTVKKAPEPVPPPLPAGKSVKP